MQFTHLHVHSHYSVLDGMSKISDLINTAVANGMYSLALTDHGAMYGIKEFAQLADGYNKGISDKIKAKQKLLTTSEDADKANIEEEIAELKKKYFKPIFGCEVYVARQTDTNKEGSRKVMQTKQDGSGYHLVLLAKNKIGYHNLCRMVSAAWIEGYYYRPRIDRALLEEFHEGIIVASACLGGELHKKIEVGDIDGAMATARWYKKIFGDDYYIELQRHKTDKPNGRTDVYEQQMRQNVELVRIATELGIELIATNDVHFVKEEHADAHERLICLSTGKKISDKDRMNYTKQEWLKSPEEMYAIFSDCPQALENTMKIVDKVEVYDIESPPLMPKFDIPSSFGTEEEYRTKYSLEDLYNEFTRNEKGEMPSSKEEGEKKIAKLGGYDKLYRIKLEADYLEKLAWDGAAKRFGDNLSQAQKERIAFELHVMKTMGFPGYFLIVQNFIQAARDMGVSVGPGRGSAAGSLVAYCLKITDLDPMKYNLLFERFLNPDRISLPDIDIDFDDDGRGDVLNWVTEKYGKERVAHIVTYGTMLAKSSIKDVARVQEYPLSETNELVKLISNSKMPDDKDGKPRKITIDNCVKYMSSVANFCESHPQAKPVLHYAAQLEETIRQVGIHACGVIIGPEDLSLHVPLSTIEDKVTKQRIVVTQYEGSKVESVGLIKMDFLGLKTLSIIKETIKNIKKSKGIDLDIDAIPIDDELTYELFSKGETVAIFQFESPGMQKYLKELQPKRFEDLIAMNALYRPGPIDYIPQFIARKHGKEAIKYDIPDMEQYLKETYGVTVYQEQVMLLSRLLANFTRGESDNLRKAMGKKQRDKLDQMKPDFIERGKKNGYDPEILEKIWTDWEKFASYAFNKSHAACYSWVAYQTAYLKAHYPAEFMAANLTKQLNSIEEISKLIDDAKRMKIKVLGPDINESDMNFTVNANGEIRFGLMGIKGVGEVAVVELLEERNKNGFYKNTVDFFERIIGHSCNRKMVESLAKAGAFDNLGDNHRAQFFYESDGSIFIEKLMRYATIYQKNKNSNQMMLFGESAETESVNVQFPECDEWNFITKCKNEQEVAGFYISGHPLKSYSLVLKSFFSNHIIDLENVNVLKSMLNTPRQFAGMIVEASNLEGRNGFRYGNITLEDETSKFTFSLFKDIYLKFGHFCKQGLLIVAKLQTKIRYKPNNEGNNANQISGNNIDDYDFVVKDIYLLDDVMANKTKSVEIYLKADEVTSDFNDNLSEIIKQTKSNKGVKCHLIIVHPIYGFVKFTTEDLIDVNNFCNQFQAKFPDIIIRLKD